MFQRKLDLEELLTDRFGSQSFIVKEYKSTRTLLAQLAGIGPSENWERAIIRLYEANAGPDVLTALWALHRTAIRASQKTDIEAITKSIHEICLSVGTRSTIIAIRAGETFFQNNVHRAHALCLLEGIVALARNAPESIPAFVKRSPNLYQRLEPDDVSRWLIDGINLYPDSKQSRLAYFSLSDPKSLSQLAHYEGRGQFSRHEAHLKHLVRCLWKTDVNLQKEQAEITAASAERLKIRGNIVLVPSTVPRRHKHNQGAYFEAAILHAAAHNRFTKNRFPIRGMKPMQIALTSLIEDARVERLAAQEYPGLAQMWLRFHTVEPTAGAPVARTIHSLFTTLALGLSDPAFQCSDSWIRKGQRLFDAAFSSAPQDQFMAERIARILGNDLGQMRIPFDPKSYAVEPDYRDDGLGLFDFDEADNPDQPPSEIFLDAAKMDRKEDVEDPVQNEDDQDVEGSERARKKPTSQDEELGVVLGLYPEWNEVLQRDQNEFVTVREKSLTPRPSPNWLTEKLSHHAGTAARIEVLARNAQFGRYETTGRALEGDIIDMDAANDVVIALQQGTSPDPRIYVRQKRAKNDVTLGLLIDMSQSTGDIPQGGQETILQMAVISTALLVEGLSAAGDAFGVFAFSSNGKDDVQLASIKSFEEDGAQVQGRLADLTPGLSTRLGSALRFLSNALQKQKTRRKIIIVLTDGEPSDIDMEDPRHLMEDARRAIALSRAKGLDLFCIPLGRSAHKSAATIFGKRNTFPLERIEDLPSRLSALYFKVTG
ncbi:MAG: VWA domain-containing protein [Alphaproteobacteria bacterium]|nr:VWA domain-containing protein [Alphaproteobacteria bacterium]